MLYFAGTFDQVNIGAFVSLEVVARRIQLITEAYSNPARPNWEAARLFMGQTLAEDAVVPALRTYVAKRRRARSSTPGIRPGS